MKAKTLAEVQELRNASAARLGLSVTGQFEDGSVYFTGEGEGRFYFKGYIGRQSRPAAFYHFRTAERRDAYAATWAAEREAARVAKQARKAEQRKPHTLQVGDVLYSSWGYEQTNVEFFEVVAVRGSVVDLRELMQDRTEYSYGMQGQCSARKGEYRGGVIAGKRPNSSNAVRLTSFSYARPWDGRAMSWSSYA